MKYFAVAIALSLNIVAANAAQIASCSSVEHHGNYVEIKDDNKKISVLLSNDGEDIEQPAKIKSISKRGVSLKDAPAASWAIRQAIKGSVDVDQSGNVSLKGTYKGKDILVVLNTYSGQHFLTIGDYTEELKCNNEQNPPETAPAAAQE